MNRWYIPKQPGFPFGYTVTVVQVPEDDPRLEERNGTWDVDTQTVYLNQALPPAERRGAFMHEYEHAYTDWKLWVAQNVPVKYPDGMDPDPNETEEDDAEKESATPKRYGGCEAS
jgi:hypothetical protein